MDIDNKQKLLIEMVMRQTMYSYDKAKEKLEENNNDYMLVIKRALGINKSKINSYFHVL